MATMFPKECKEDVNNAEKKVFKVLKSTLSEDIVCYHNYNVDSKETDFILAVPGEGICIIEVKNWTGRKITKVIDKDTIEYIDNGELKKADSPLSQCKGYCYGLRRKVQNELKCNIKVVPIVFFPFMTEYIYEEKQLNIVTPRELTILQNDIEDRDKFINIINQKMKSIKPKNLNEFREELYVSFCGLFEDNEILKNRLVKYENDSRKIIRMFTKCSYSILIYININEGEILFKKQLEKLYHKWIVGTKIILVVKSKDDFFRVIKYFEDQINSEMAYLNGYEDFNIYDKKGNYKNRIFNLEIYHFLEEYNNEIKDFVIIDGNGIDSYIHVLKIFDEHTDFNFNQYELEHSSYDGNIVVKAGAGTGKTYSMISRIGYLYYINNYIPEDLLSKIIMITFTNEATDNMKKKLKEYFTNLAILTERSEFIHLMEYISKMQISTIDSLMKKILQKFSVYLGLGNSIKITTEIYDTRQEISKELEKLLLQREYENILQYISKYNLSKAIEKFIDLIYKKKIDLEAANNFKEIEGDEAKLVFDFIKEATTNINRTTTENNIKNNTVHLNCLLIFMKKLIMKLEDDNYTSKMVDYIFIDEFQDTDDLTIDLIRRSAKIFNFNIFVVGDIKQSIYRFRGADDAAFDKLKRGIKNWGISKINNYDYFTINKNYRSSKELLDELDNIFAQWGKGIQEYGKVLNYSDDDKLIGVISKKDGLKPISKIVYENDFENKIKDLLSKKIGLLKEKKEGSIVILVRENRQVEEIRRIYEDIYKETKIPIETNKTENLYTMAPTIDLYRLVLALKYYNNPKYLYSLSLSNYAPEISKLDVYKNRSNRNYINKLFMENKIINNWNEIVKKLGNQTILRVIRSIIQEIKPWEQYSLNFAGNDEREYEKLRYKRNLDLLLENIMQRSSSEYITINSLSKYLEIMIFAKQHQDERQERRDKKKIRIVCETIHKSKGLEYDEVIIPYTCGSLSKRFGDEIIVNNGVIYVKMKIKQREEEEFKIESINYDSETKVEYKDLIKEEARILYVALTRAKERVTWFKKVDKKNKISWADLLDIGDEDDEDK